MVQEAAPPSTAEERARWGRQLIVRSLAWLVPVAIVWLVLTPFYNRFLTVSAENLRNLAESPDVTRLLPTDRHYITISRGDFPPARSNLYRVRVTDIHFPLILMGALFLAVPGVAFKKRLSDLGVATLISVFFHILLLFLWVQFVYATQLGAWSQENYSGLEMNVWGMAKHMLDLVFKFALPLALWVGFYFRLLLGKREATSSG